MPNGHALNGHGPYGSGASNDTLDATRDAVTAAMVELQAVRAKALTLGTVAGASFATQVGVLVGIATLMTVGVYGLVAGIVKLDDVGLWLSREAHALQRALGRGILRVAPLMMKTLSVLGTAAMFLVGGGILTHGIPGMHGYIERSAHASGALPAVGDLAEALTPMALDGVTGVVAGALCVGVVTLARRLRGSRVSA